MELNQDIYKIILLSLDNIYDLYLICHSNKHFITICSSFDFWNQWYNKFNFTLDHGYENFNGYFNNFVDKYTKYITDQQAKKLELIYTGLLHHPIPVYFNSDSKEKEFNIKLTELKRKYDKAAILHIIIYNNTISLYINKSQFASYHIQCNAVDIYNFIHTMLINHYNIKPVNLQKHFISFLF